MHSEVGTLLLHVGLGTGRTAAAVGRSRGVILLPAFQEAYSNNSDTLCTGGALRSGAVEAKAWQPAETGLRDLGES